MTQQLLDSPRHFVPEDLSPQLRQEWGIIDNTFSLAALALMTDGKLSAHYEGPDSFPEVVTLGRRIEHLKGATTPLAERWQSYKDIPDEIRQKIKVISFEQSDVRIMMARVTHLASVIMANPDREATLGLRVEYKKLIDRIMIYCQLSFQENRDRNTVAVTLLRGGARFEDSFPVRADRLLRVNAKRLDFGKKMIFGFTDWEGLDLVPQALEREGYSYVELSFADDCLATTGSIRATYISLKNRADQGLFPQIKAIYIYAAVGAQPGIMDLLNDPAMNDVEINIVVGDVAYQLSKLGYIQRALEEKKPDGTEYTPGEQVVGDMGSIMS